MKSPLKWSRRRAEGAVMARLEEMQVGKGMKRGRLFSFRVCWSILVPTGFH